MCNVTSDDPTMVDWVPIGGVTDEDTNSVGWNGSSSCQRSTYVSAVWLHTVTGVSVC